MKKFDDYEVIDFLLNDSFVQWASGALYHDNDYWSSFKNIHPNKKEAFNQAKEIVVHLKIKPVKNLTHAEVDELIQSVLNKSHLTIQSSEGKLIEPKWFNSGWLKIAASIILISVAASIGYISLKPAKQLLSQQQLPQFIERFNETSATIWVRLPDRTSVILKPGSHLRYPTVFAKQKREVYLTGEAFFEVTKNPKQPFFVYANEMTTRVLGTSFTVKAFKGDKNFKVIVNTGKVAVFADTHLAGNTLPKNSILVVPNQEATFYRKQEKLVKANLNKPSMLSIAVSKTLFNFNETPFSKVVATIKEAYGVNITYNEKNLANCPLTASLTNQPLYEKLDLICKAVEAHYEVNDGEIYIDGKGCHN